MVRFRKVQLKQLRKEIEKHNQSINLTGNSRVLKICWSFGRQVISPVIFEKMKKTMNYIISGSVLTIGIVIIVWGSLLILDRYELQSMNIEDLKAGVLPSGDHAKWVKERGFSEGMFHIIFLICGTIASVLSSVHLFEIKNKKGI